ncbi:4Fe-4S ferredoxin [bacterium]|nr:4Fe-4S ferredoxin [bacterium]
MDLDIVCVGFGPAMGGFLTTLSKGLVNEDGTPAVDSKVMPGMPPQVICYERADDLGFGVSGVVTRGRAIKGSFPELNLDEIPMAAPVKEEQLLYLMDPIGASRRPLSMRLADGTLKALKWMLPVKDHAFKVPYIPAFMEKHDGFLASLGQFNQWVGGQLMASGAVQIWPGTPVEKPLIENGAVTGVQLIDQGVDKKGEPDAGFMPGMEIKAPLTVIADGPIGPVGRQIDEALGMPEGHHHHDWAVGMKMVIDLPETCELEVGTVIHTLGFPEPEIFGFLYVYPGKVASAGIFVPSWFDNPVRSTYRYLQHWLQHPALWKHLKGGTMRSWGAKTIQESGRRGEPHLVGNGFARIGEGSGSTNVLTNSGVDEAWMTGVQLADGVLELMKEGKEFTKENLEATYVKRRRESWLEEESRMAEKARDGFQRSFLRGMIGMAMSGFTKGKMNMSGDGRSPYQRVPTPEEYYKGRISPDGIANLRADCQKAGKSLHDELMNRVGWPEIEYDGQILMSHQDALLKGGKVQAPGGYADHVVFLYPSECEKCGTQVCVEICSGQAITTNPDGGVPLFDREKCVHCGACLWNCATHDPANPEKGGIQFKAGAGGLHSAEN